MEADNLFQMNLRSIAHVSNDINDPYKHGWDEVVSDLVIHPDFEGAVNGLEEFSHLVVLLWMHRLPPEGRSTIKTHPQKRSDLPLVGVFATRSPARPNPLGMTIVRLLERRGDILRVIGLDAINGTPVVDIKPYLPGDSIPDAKVADWVHKLH